jgi:hypothetical protein
MNIARISKALVAAGVAVAAVLPQVLSDGNLSGLEALNLAGAALVAGYAVYKVPNAPAASLPPKRL